MSLLQQLKVLDDANTFCRIGDLTMLFLFMRPIRFGCVNALVVVKQRLRALRRGCVIEARNNNSNPSLLTPPLLIDTIEFLVLEMTFIAFPIIMILVVALFP